MSYPQTAPQISPSLLAADAAKLGQEVTALEKAGADRLHFDVMDGHFVPYLSFGPHILKALQHHTTLPIDVHLMVKTPRLFIETFCTAGAASLTIHVEIEEDLLSLLGYMRQFGIKVGLALNPDTPPSALEPFLDHIHLILLMTVQPGRGGQFFLPGQEKKVAQVRALIGKRPITLHVDGGVTLQNASLLHTHGAHVLVAGTAILQAPCYREAIQKLRAIADPL